MNQDQASQSLWQEQASLDDNRSENVLVNKDIDQVMKSPWYKSISQLHKEVSNLQQVDASSSSESSAPIVSQQEGPPPLRRSPRKAEQMARKVAESQQSTIVAHSTCIINSNTLEDGTYNEILPHAMVSSVNSGDPDTMHYGDARKQPD